MDAVMHSNEEVKTALKKFVLVKLDASNPAVKSMGIRAIPVVIVYSSSGKEISRSLGYSSPEKLIKTLEDMAAKATASK